MGLSCFYTASIKPLIIQFFFISLRLFLEVHPISCVEIAGKAATHGYHS